MGMSASPLDRITPAFPALARHGSVQAGREALVTGRSVWPHLAVLTAFWIYVALSNVLYANNMQASLSSMKMEHVFAAWDARLSEHLLGEWEHEHHAGSARAWTEFFGGPEIPVWIASATNFLVTYGFGLALITGFAFYQ